MPKNNLTPLIERIMRRVEMVTESGCWIWMGATIKDYGVIGRGRVADGNVLVHRATYEHFRGPIPDGLEPDHLCRVPPCCNPWHLELVTRAENVRRGEAAKRQLRKTHCPQGHEYTSENTYRRPGKISRFCRTCMHNRLAAFHQKNGPVRRKPNGAT